MFCDPIISTRTCRGSPVSFSVCVGGGTQLLYVPVPESAEERLSVLRVVSSALPLRRAAVGEDESGAVDLGAVAEAAEVSRPFPSWNRSILTEISLCHACSRQEILRVETARQGYSAADLKVGG
jgi:hypothetical protein